LRKWLQEEHEAKKGGPIDLSDWEDYWDDVSFARTVDLRVVNALIAKLVDLAERSSTRQFE